MLRRVHAALVVLSVFAPSVAAASPEDLFGYGARTNAMGATGTAHADGGDAAWHNPALFSLARQSALSFGFQDAVYSLPVDAEAARGVTLNGAVPLRFGGILRDRFGFGFGVYTPSNVVVRGRVLYPEKPQYPLLTDRAQSVMIRAGIGGEIGWGFRFGVGVAALAELSGKVVAAADGTRVDDRLIAKYAPEIGISWERDAYRIGAVFRGKLDARFDVVVDGSHLTTLPIPVFDIAGLAQYDPAQFALEAARSDRDRVVALQFVYKRWSDYPGLLTPTVVCRDGTENCGLQPPKIDWRDTFAIRAGLEQRIHEVIRLRAGGWVETSALPDSLPAGVSYHDGTRAVVTAGGGVTAAPFAVDLYAQEHFVVGEGHITVFGLSGTVTF